MHFSVSKELSSRIVTVSFFVPHRHRKTGMHTGEIPEHAFTQRRGQGRSCFPEKQAHRTCPEHPHPEGDGVSGHGILG